MSSLSFRRKRTVWLLHISRDSGSRILPRTEKLPLCPESSWWQQITSPLISYLSTIWHSITFVLVSRFPIPMRTISKGKFIFLLVRKSLPLLVIDFLQEFRKLVKFLLNRIYFHKLFLFRSKLLIFHFSLLQIDKRNDSDQENIENKINVFHEEKYFAAQFSHTFIIRNFF